MPFLKTIKRFRWTTVVVTLGSLFLLYCGIGFLLVPYIAKKYAGNIVQDKFGVKSEIQKVYFNPFSFVVEVTKFKIPERLELGKLKFDLELFPLFEKQIKLKYIYLGDTNLALVKSDDGTTNWTTKPNKAESSETKTTEAKAEDGSKKEDQDKKSVQTSSWQIRIDDIALERISTSLILKKGDKPNVKKGAPAKGSKKDLSSPADILITQLRIIENQINFVDQKSNPDFKGSLDHLNGVIKPITLAPGQKINIDLKGLIGAFGTVGIGGFIIADRTKPSLDISVNISNVAMTMFTPYSGRFAGYEVSKGKLFLNTNYKLKDQYLHGKNNLILDQFTLGKGVKSKDATNWPVKLILALVKDGDGKIRMDVPVKGDVNSPKFSFGGAIWTAVENIIINIISSPFAFLGSLFGGGDDVDSIFFEAGKDVFSSGQESKLKGIAKALVDRPSLNLEVNGAYNDADAKVLNKEITHDALKSLAIKRGHVVQSALVALKVKPERIFVLSDAKLEKDGKAPRALLVLKNMD